MNELECKILKKKEEYVVEHYERRKKSIVNSDRKMGK